MGRLNREVLPLLEELWYKANARGGQESHRLSEWSVLGGEGNCKVSLKKVAAAYLGGCQFAGVSAQCFRSVSLRVCARVCVCELC